LTYAKILEKVNDMNIIGITGGIGSGKTTCCQIFECMGVPAYYADDRAKKLMTEHPDVINQVKALLGASAYHDHGELNREYIANKIFNDKALLQNMNDIIHPAVAQDAIAWANDQSSQYVIYEAALLVENGSYKNMTKLIVVSCPEEIRIKRVMSRDHSTKAAVLSRMKNQLPESAKIKVADYTIDNSGEKSIIPQIFAIHNQLINLI